MICPLVGVTTMHRFKPGFLYAGLLLAGLAALSPAQASATGESDQNRVVREELDADLKKLVDIPPPRIELIFNTTYRFPD